jgi:hypothetical protein
MLRDTPTKIINTLWIAHQGNGRIVSQLFKYFAKCRGYMTIDLSAVSECELIGIGIQQVELLAVAWS